MRIGIYDVDKSWCEQMRQIVETYAKQMSFDVKIIIFDDRNTIMEYGMRNRFPDVLFLSLDENGKAGIEIGREINGKSQECQIVFCSDNFEYAMDVYTVEHTSFVIKEQFKNRINEIFCEIKKNKLKRKKRYVFSATGGKKVILYSEEIIYFERIRRTTRIVSTFGIYEIRDKIDDLLEVLSEKDFFRCHNSYIVYLPAVREVSSGNFVMSNWDMVAISRNYRKIVKEMFTS